MKKIINGLSTLLIIGIMLLAIWLMVLKVSGDTPSFFGYRLYRIVTGSMEPVYKVNDVILVKEVDIANLDLGDDITYVSHDNQLEGMRITHRIIEKPKQDSKGTWHLQTQGINDGCEKDAPITNEQVIGKVTLNCKFITEIYKVFMTKLGLVLFLTPLLFMMCLEIINIVRISKGEDSNVEEIKNQKECNI